MHSTNARSAICSRRSCSNTHDSRIQLTGNSSTYRQERNTTAHAPRDDERRNRGIHTYIQPQRSLSTMPPASTEHIDREPVLDDAHTHTTKHEIRICNHHHNPHHHSISIARRQHQPASSNRAIPACHTSPRTPNTNVVSCDVCPRACNICLLFAKDRASAIHRHRARRTDAGIGTCVCSWTQYEAHDAGGVHSYDNRDGDQYQEHRELLNAKGQAM